MGEWKLFLDDERMPAHNAEEWVIARTNEQAKEEIGFFGCPSFIQFDHDLGEGGEAQDLVKWLINQDMDSNFKFIPDNFDWDTHSQNPEGAKTIDGLLSCYLRHRNSIKNNPCRTTHIPPVEVRMSPKFVLDQHDAGYYLAKQGNEKFPVGYDKDKAIRVIEKLNKAHRPNVELMGTTLMVCFNDHDKGQPCEYEVLVEKAFYPWMKIITLNKLEN